MLRSGFFAENALGDGPVFRIFPGLTDYGPWVEDEGYKL